MDWTSFLFGVVVGLGVFWVAWPYLNRWGMGPKNIDAVLKKVPLETLQTMNRKTEDEIARRRQLLGGQ